MLEWWLAVTGCTCSLSLALLGFSNSGCQGSDCNPGCHGSDCAPGGKPGGNPGGTGPGTTTTVTNATGPVNGTLPTTGADLLLLGVELRMCGLGV